MPNPWILLAFVLALIAAALGGEYDGAQRGHAAERIVWQAKDNAELAGANAKILQLEQAARAAEQSHAAALAAISTTYQKELRHAATQHQADIAAVRSGALRLLDPGAPAVQACGSSSSQAAAGTAGRDGGPQPPGLSPGATEFLLGQADAANAIVRQLTACQAVIISDRTP